MTSFDTYQIIITVIGYLFGAGGLVFWFLERKKFNAEVATALEAVQTNKIDNDIKLSSHYREILDDLKARYEKEFQDVVGMYQRKIKALEDEILLHKRINNNLKREIKDLKSRIKELESK